MWSLFRLSIPVFAAQLSLALLFRTAPGAEVPVRAGILDMSLDANALARLANISGPTVPTLILQHFYSVPEASTWTRTQLVGSAPWSTENLPSPTHLLHVVNGNSVEQPQSDPPGLPRYRQPTTLLYDPRDVLGSWTPSDDILGNRGEQIGLDGVHRFIGDLGAELGERIFLWGDFDLSYNPNRPQGSGLFLRNNFDGFHLPLFDIDNATITATQESLSISGSLRLTPEVAFAFFYGDVGVTLGTFTLTASTILPGDYNDDGEVDYSDLSVWQQQFGATMVSPADGNHNGIVDAADFTYWRDHAQTSLPSSLELGVPEPAHLSSMAGLAMLVVRYRRYINDARHHQ